MWQGKINFNQVLIVPDKWEFPWLAGWDTGFQAVAAIHADPNLAKQQRRPARRWLANLDRPCALHRMDVDHRVPTRVRVGGQSDL